MTPTYLLYKDEWVKLVPECGTLMMEMILVIAGNMKIEGEKG